MVHQVRREVLAALLSVLALLAGCAAPSRQVTDEDIRREYDKVVARAFSGTEYAVRHILVEKQEQAVAALQRIKSGESFARIAMELSADPGSRNKGGELGWSLPEHFTPEFSRAMVMLAPGGLSPEPVRTPFGWHVIEVTGARQQQPPPFDVVKDRIAESLRQSKAR